jgi:hypothetical protein
MTGREQLDEVLAAASRIPCAGGGRDTACGACADESRKGGSRECGRHRGGPAEGSTLRASETEVDGRLDDVPPVDREHGGVPVACKRQRQQVAQELEKLGRAVVRGADAVQIDVVAVEPGVDERRRPGRSGELLRERRGVEIVHLERGAAPPALLVVAAAAVRGDQDERARPANDYRLERAPHRPFLAPVSGRVHLAVSEVRGRTAESSARTRPARHPRAPRRASRSRRAPAWGRLPPRRRIAATAARSAVAR